MIPIADSGFVVAVLDIQDQDHIDCLPIYLRYKTIYLPQTALTEVIYYMKKYHGSKAAASFLLNLSKSHYTLIALEPPDVRRAGELMDKYADSRLDFVDTSVIAIAERLNITRDRQARFWNGAPNSCRCV